MTNNHQSSSNKVQSSLAQALKAAIADKNPQNSPQQNEGTEKTKSTKLESSSRRPNKPAATHSQPSAKSQQSKQQGKQRRETSSGLAESTARQARPQKQVRPRQVNLNPRSQAVSQQDQTVPQQAVSQQDLASSPIRELPPMEYDAELPVSARREEIAKAIEQHQIIIVSGETGSGKTTQLPKICLELGRGQKGLIGHTQPRRIAAVSVAKRIAQELKTTLGDWVGYQVRFNDKTGPQAAI